MGIGNCKAGILCYNMRGTILMLYSVLIYRHPVPALRVDCLKTVQPGLFRV